MRADPLPHSHSSREKRAGWRKIAVALAALFVASRVSAAEPQDEAAARVAIAKTGDFPQATPLKKPAVLWKYTAKPQAANINRRRNPNAGIGVSDPIYFDGEVYVGDDGGTVHAIRASDGVPLWETRVMARIFHAPFVDADGVYCTCEPRGVVALNR